MTKEISLTKGYTAIVDDADFEQVGQYKWTALVTGQHIKRIYAYRRSEWDNTQRRYKRIIYLHRFVLKAADGFDVDHVDGDTLNNTRRNLRLASRSENLANNRRPVGRTGYRGVTTDYRDGAFIAQCGGRYLGRFKADVDAAAAYDTEARMRFGDFAKLNFS